VVLRGSGKELKDVWKTELLSLRGFELRIFFHVTHFDESKIQYHCPCSKYFTIILLSENFLKAISLIEHLFGYIDTKEFCNFIHSILVYEERTIVDPTTYKQARGLVNCTDSQ